jgi:uncharacterized RDD family membrane protein YckC
VSDEHPENADRWIVEAGENETWPPVADRGIVRPAPLWRRAIATTLDWVALVTCIVLFMFVCGITMAATEWDTRAIQWLPITFCTLAIFLFWIYCALSESSMNQCTIGQRLLGVKVVDLQGQRIGFKQATVRHFFKYGSLGLLGLGFLMAGFTTNKQTLHDRFAECLVVYR